MNHYKSYRNMGGTKLKGTLAFLLTLMLIFSVWTWDMPAAKAEEGSFAQGDGTEGSPYGISTPEQLNAVRDYPDAYFIMLNNIDMNEATSEGGAFWNDGAGWEPIVELNGSFDGDGHSVSGLYIHRPDEGLIGLFGVLQSGATVKSLDLSGCSILGMECSGAVAGRNGGIIDSCSVSGSVSTVIPSGGVSSDMAIVGGLVGYNEGSISGCTNRATVSGRMTLGGIAGSNNYIITQCRNMGNVINPDAIENTGGIAGNNNLYGTISYCSNTAKVSGRVYTGGIAGTNYNLITHCNNSGEVVASIRQNGGIAGISSGVIESCYNSGIVRTTGSIEDRTGGIIGQLNDGGQITDCFNTGEISADNIFGGIAGYCEGAITNCYNAAEDGITGSSTGSAVSCYYLDDGKTHTDGTVSTAGQLRQQDTFTGYDFSDVWQIDEGQSPPVLQGMDFVNATGITLSQSTLGMFTGASETLTAAVTPADATNRIVEWYSSDVNIARVINGTVTAVAPGTAVITAKSLDGGFTDTCDVTVAAPQPVTSVTLSRSSKTMADGDTLTLTATVLPDDATYPTVTWSSSNTATATVSQSGLVTAVGIGTATITATADGVSNTCEVTVVLAAIQSSHYTIDQTASLIKGVADGTTVAQLKSRLDNDSDLIKVYDVDDQEVTEGIVGTGMTVKYSIDGELKDSLSVVVTGDTSGDGAISISDYVLVRLDILGLKDLSGAYSAAGDVNGDGQRNVTDYTLIRLDILGEQNVNG